MLNWQPVITTPDALIKYLSVFPLIFIFREKHKLFALWPLHSITAFVWLSQLTVLFQTMLYGPNLMTYI